MGVSTATRTWLPFGAGISMCPGRMLALKEVKIMAALVLHYVELELEAQDQPVPKCDPARVGLGIYSPLGGGGGAAAPVRWSLRGEAGRGPPAVHADTGGFGAAARAAAGAASNAAAGTAGAATSGVAEAAVGAATAGVASAATSDAACAARVAAGLDGVSFSSALFSVSV